ncbi:MAG TPA: alpha/beta hydrolase [Vicinamibacterales bacterium]|nr:alpha/beta hydrolase [Vicinamibacterales bacterium]
MSITAASQIPRPAGPPPGVLIDVGSHKLHLQCVGPAGSRPVVILEAGGGAYSTAWAAVQKALPRSVRSCSYDRAGLGWSEDGPLPRTMAQEVFELHALLARANVPGPYVLVGHSIGGLLVRMYAAKYGSDVSGVVLAAGTHESARLGVIGKGWARVRELATGRAVPEPALTKPQPSAKGQAYDPSQDYFADELQLMYLSRLQNREPLGERPLIVLAPMRMDPPPPGTSEELWRELRVEKDDQAAGLVLLSTNSKLIRDRTSGHQIHNDNPALVARAIEQVVEAVLKGTRLDRPQQ